MSTLPKKKADAVESRILLRLNRKSILLTVRETPRSILLYMGGRHLYCCSAQIIKPANEISNLITVDFNTQCSIENDFQRGIDTTMLVRLMITYIARTYPFVTTLKLDDVSTRTCDDNSYVHLSELSYITTGKTWYERQSPAYLDNSAAAEFKEADRTFQALKSTLSWADITDRYILEDTPFDDLYRATGTWQEFFRAVRDTMGMSEFCTWCATWLHLFLQDTLPFQFPYKKYFIPVATSTPVDYKEEPYTQGGRSTRRNPIKRKRREV